MSHGSNTIFGISTIGVSSLTSRFCSRHPSRCYTVTTPCSHRERPFCVGRVGDLNRRTASAKGARRHLVLRLHRHEGAGHRFRAAPGCMTGAWLRLGSTPDRAAITRDALAGFQWCAETLLTVSVSKSPDAERPTSPRLMMPTIRLLLLITGSLRTCNFSM